MHDTVWIDTDEFNTTAEQAAALVNYAFGFFVSHPDSLSDALDILGNTLDAVFGYLNALDPTAVTAGFELPSFGITSSQPRRLLSRRPTDAGVPR